MYFKIFQETSGNFVVLSIICDEVHHSRHVLLSLISLLESLGQLERIWPSQKVVQGIGATPKAKDAAETQEGTVVQCSICWI